jgi:hypothetical protein
VKGWSPVVWADPFTQTIRMVNRYIKDIAACMIDLEIFALHAADGTNYQADEASYTKLDVDDEITWIDVCKVIFWSDFPWPAPSTRNWTAPTENFGISQEV